MWKDLEEVSGWENCWGDDSLSLNKMVSVALELRLV